MSKESCARCRYWDQINEERGQCRRLSPRWHPDAVHGGGVMGDWPQTLIGDWCGEWDYKMSSAQAPVGVPGTVVTH